MIFEKVCQLVREQLPVDGKEITLESRLVEDLGADSANVMMLVMDIEAEYNITMEDDCISQIRTIGDVVSYLEAHV